MSKKHPRGLIYLCGSMEYSPDGGRGWRLTADKALRDLGYQVYNPASDEQAILEPFGLKSAEEFLALKKDPATYGRFREVMKRVIQFDLEKLEQSDAILAFLDKTISGGSAGELTIARWRLGIPTYSVVDPADLPHISGWIGACLSHIFKDMDTCLDYVKKYGLL